MSSSELELLSHIYVLRCWLEPQTQPSSPAPTWRFRLENTGDEQAKGFATVDELIWFLQKTFGNSSNNEGTIMKESTV